jgi:hypothetical protein
VLREARAVLAALGDAPAHLDARQVAALDELVHARHLVELPARPARLDAGRADHHHPRLGPERRVQRLALVEAAQVAHADEVRAGDGQSPYPRPGGQQQLVVAQRLVPVEGHRVAGQVEVGGPDPEQQLHVVLRVPLGVVHERLVARVGTEQVSLGQRRPLVGPLGLLPDQHDPTGEPVVPQTFRRLCPGQ